MSYNDENDFTRNENSSDMPEDTSSVNQPEPSSFDTQANNNPVGSQPPAEDPASRPYQDCGYQWNGSSYRNPAPEQHPSYVPPTYTPNSAGYYTNPSAYQPGYNYANGSVPPVPPKKKKRGGVIAAVVAAALVLLIGVGVTCGVVVHNYITDGSEKAAAADSTSTPEPTSAPTENNNTQVVLGGSNNHNDNLSSSIGASGTMDAKSIYNMACQQVVGIKTEVTGQNIFGQTVTSAVSGSGFIISSDGYIATNYHVISTALNQGVDVTVMMVDGSSYTAEIIGGDEENDVAVLKIDANDLNAVTFGDSNNMAVGETVYAVGNPLGELTYTMTSGIVSALDREISTDSQTSINMFQLDAAVNSGNSGGPVYNSDGEVIGIVTAKYSDTGVEGLSFAIPINDALAIVQDIIENGYVTGRAYMGITAVTVTSSTAQYYNMAEGAYIYAVDETACAAKAGLKVGDIVTAMDGEAVTSSSDLVTMVRRHKAGDTVTMDVYRNGDTVQLTITFDEKKQESNETGSEQEQQENQGQQGNLYEFSPFSGSSMN